MRLKHKLIWMLLSAALVLTGCSMRTADQMYLLPRRTEQYNDLQKAIDKAMDGLEYSAPRAGENQQTVQMVDLDGDGLQEYLVYAKGASERPLRILVFRSQNGSYVHSDTIESNGTAFDQVEYVQMDGVGGVEIVVGRQLDGQTLGAVSVYTFSHGPAEQLVSASYRKFLTVDLNADALTELFILRPGQTETDRGIAEFYAMQNGAIYRSNEVNMSEPADKLKRVLVGTLHGGQPAVYIASAVGDTAIITDVYALLDGLLTNVTFSNESGTSVQTMRNYYVYADDIDNDGVVELPMLINMKAMDEPRAAERQDLIRWYAMEADGSEVDKMYTYHNFVAGWYFQLDSEWAPRLSVRNIGNSYEFHLWDEDYTSARKLLTIYALTGQNREEQAMLENRFVVYKTEQFLYAASLEPVALENQINQESIIRRFHLIHQDWKSGET